MMKRKIIADTSFLIDLLRPERHVRRQAAESWLSRNAGLELVLTATVLGEFAAGFDETSHPEVEHLREGHEVLPVDETVALSYARLFRKLDQTGKALGPNDTWIAAAALTHGLPVLTKNSEAFRRVNGLNVVDYV